MGQGRGGQHRFGRESTIPRVGMDYFFLASVGTKEGNGLEYSDEALEQARPEGDVLKCLVVRCCLTKSIFGHVVPVKGADGDDFAVNATVAVSLWLGRRR